MENLLIPIIKEVVQTTFGKRPAIKTTLSYVTQLVKNQYPEITEETIKEAMADIEGWERAQRAQKDEIIITSLFFA